MSYLLNMTWAEFQIRLFAYERIQKREDFRVREIAFYSLIGSHCDPKKLPKSKESFWSIGTEKAKEISEEHKNAFLKAHEQYLIEIQDAENNS